MTWMCQISAVQSHTYDSLLHSPRRQVAQAILCSSVRPRVRLVLIFAALTQWKSPMLYLISALTRKCVKCQVTMNTSYRAVSLGMFVYLNKPWLNHGLYDGLAHMRRFTSTAPARGARTPNRAISNSCLWY